MSTRRGATTKARTHGHASGALRRLREAELKHGRLAMVALAGWPIATVLLALVTTVSYPSLFVSLGVGTTSDRPPGAVETKSLFGQRAGCALFVPPTACDAVPLSRLLRVAPVAVGGDMRSEFVDVRGVISSVS